MVKWFGGSDNGILPPTPTSPTLSILPTTNYQLPTPHFYQVATRLPGQGVSAMSALRDAE